MTDEARAARAAYTREYRHRNPDKVKKWRASYWERKAAALAEKASIDRLAVEKGGEEA